MGSSSSKSKKIQEQTGSQPLSELNTPIVSKTQDPTASGWSWDEENKEKERNQLEEKDINVDMISEDHLKLLRICFDDLGLHPLNGQNIQTVIEKVAAQVKVQVYDVGTDVIIKGQEADKLFVIKKGHVDVVSEDGSVVLANLLPGNYFGEVSLLFSIPCTANVRTATESQLLCLDKEIIWHEFDHVRVDIIDWFVCHNYLPTSHLLDAQRTQRRTVLACLKSVHLFADWSTHALKSLILEMGPTPIILYPVNSAILLQEDTINHLWIVLRGRISTKINGNTITVLDTSIKKMPFVIGEEGLFLQKTNHLNIWCVSCCQVLHVQKYMIDSVIQQFPKEVGELWHKCGQSWQKFDEKKVNLQRLYPALLQVEVLLELLYQNPLLKTCGYCVLQSLVVGAVPQQYKTGVTVFDKKEYNRDKGSMAVVVKGRLKLLTISENHTVHEVEQGGIFYKCSWMPEKAMVVASYHTDTLVWRISSQVVTESFSRNKDCKLFPPIKPDINNEPITSVN